MLSPTNKECLLSPPPALSDKPRLRYTLRMVADTLGESISLLRDLVRHDDATAIANQHIQHFWKRIMTSSHTRLCAVGREHVDRTQSYVYMSNHQSLMDIPALFGAVPQPLRMVSKKQLFRIPFFGKAMLKAGFIPIDRTNREKAILQLETAKERLKQGLSVWIAPEGTRSRTLELGPFKKGGFHIAMDLQIPIVPVWIDGSARVIYPDSSKVHPNQEITVYFGKPISPALFANDLTSLMAAVRNELLILSQSI